MSGGSVKRLMREYKNAQAAPIREFLMAPLEDNIFEWHFTMMGPADSVYAEGFYHGRILIPTNYPFAPPDVCMLTASGRFEQDKRICLSISSFHPENWHPTWGITTVLHALREFMLTPGNNAIAAIDYPKEVKAQLALDSVNYCCKECGAKVAEHKEELLAAPPATPADIAKDKDQSLPTPDMKPKQAPVAAAKESTAEAAKPASAPDSPSTTATPADKPVEDEEAQAKKAVETAEKAEEPAPKQDTLPREPERTEKQAAKTEKAEVTPKLEPAAAVAPVQEAAEPAGAGVAPAPAQPAAAAAPAQPRRFVRHQARNGGVEIRLSITLLDRALLVVAFFLSLLLLRKLFIHWELVKIFVQRMVY